MQTTARRKAPTRAVPSGRKSCLTVLLIATAVALAARAGAAGGEAPSVAGTFVVGALRGRAGPSLSVGHRSAPRTRSSSGIRRSLPSKKAPPW